jgi:hypothetical protein
VKKLACILCVLGTSVALSATGALAWDDLDAMISGLQWHSQPNIKGNDTGGIIAWSPDNELRARDLADAFCKDYGKYPRITGVHRQFGDYISFNCVWNPTVARFALPAMPLARPR